MRPFARFAMTLTSCVGLSCAMPAAAQDEDAGGARLTVGARLYGAQCQLCHGTSGDGIPGINLARQQFKTVVSDDDIRKMITTGNPRGMPPSVFRPDELDALVAFVRAGLDPSGRGGPVIELGDAAQGKTIYDREGCAACHRIDGEGSRIGPDLSGIGFMRRPVSLRTSLTTPEKTTQPINRPITIVTKDGRTIKGRRYNEDTESVQVIDTQEKMLSIEKADIRQYEVSMTTSMPSYQAKLNETELADLLAYLVSLKRH